MKVFEQECDGCGRLVRTARDGDGCGACDVVLCGGCLDGTASCPGCQRRFAQTRNLPAAARRRPSDAGSTRLALLAGAVMLGGLAFVAFLGEGGASRRERRGDEAEAARGVVSSRLYGHPVPEDLSAWEVSIGEARCHADVAGRRRVAERVRRVRFGPSGPNDLEFGLGPALRALGGQVRVSPGVRGVPFAGRIGGSPHDDDLVLLIDGWSDPVVGERAASGGRLSGRMRLWSARENRLVCAADVIHELPADDPLPEDGDPLGSARTALLIGAFVAGLDGLHEVREVSTPIGLRGGAE